MRFWIFVTFTLLCHEFGLLAQKKTIQYDLWANGLVSTGKTASFWSISNKFGTFSARPFGGNVRTKVFTTYDSAKVFDYAYGVELLNRFDKQYKFRLQQGYFQARYQFITFLGGKIEESFGNQDSDLSSGGILWSNNAPPLPKLTIGILQYTTVPFTKGLVEIKGALSHGWFENTSKMKNEWLHHKYIYVRVGGNFPVKIHYGFQHFAQWGGKSSDNSIGQLPSSIKDYLIVFFAKQIDTTGVSGIQRNEYSNRIGNHLGSKQFGLDLDLNRFSISTYYQSIFEDNSGRRWLNFPDGLWGLTLKLTHNEWLQKITYEILSTTNQSMTRGDDKVNGEPDNYFNHYIYQNGWSYDSYGIGTPLITSPNLSDQMGLTSSVNTVNRFVNNKVLAHHLGMMGTISETHYKVLLTYTKNYGLHFERYAPTRESVMGYVELQKQLKKWYNIEVSVGLAADFGRMYSNNSSILFTLRKSGIIF